MNWPATVAQVPVPRLIGSDKAADDLTVVVDPISLSDRSARHVYRREPAMGVAQEAVHGRPEQVPADDIALDVDPQSRWLPRRCAWGNDVSELAIAVEKAAAARAPDHLLLIVDAEILHVGMRQGH